MPETQPGAATPEAADALIDRFLDVSEPEDTKEKPRKPARPDGSEKYAPEDEPDDAGDDELVEGDEEGEDTGSDEPVDGSDDDDQSPESEEGRYVGQNGRVKLQDGSVTTVGELVRGNLRMADYTRKTQETGALHQELQARAADYAQQDQIVSLAIDIMAAALPPEPDPRLLQPGEQHDPIAFTSQKLRWEEAAKQLQAMQYAKQQMDQRNQQIQGTMLKRYALQEKDKLLDHKPELADRKKLDAYHADLLKTLGRYGKTEYDLAQVYDSSIIRMVEDLGYYWKILGARKAARQKSQGVPVLQPSTRQSPSGRKARSRSTDWDTLRKTGSKGASGSAALDRIFDDLIK